ncbi:MMPL family transporter [Nakamurella silvestris]|nr:MMPL family transporter [Nakamurella silvestris]
MASFLYRLGQFSFRKRRLVAALWAGALILIGVGSVTLSGESNDAFSIPGTESQKALDLLSERFPAANLEGGSAQIVFQAPDGQKLTDPANTAAIDRVVGSLAAVPQVKDVPSPFQAQTVSPDGSAAFATIHFSVTNPEVTPESKQEILDITSAASASGLEIEVVGQALETPPAAVGSGEIVGVLIAALVLFLTLGSLVAAGLPLLTAFVGVGVGVLGITMASGFLDISSSTPILAMMLGLAVGIDYGLFIITRYRSELGYGRTREEAIGRATGTAGSAVVFAGLTVIIALAGLSVVGIPFLTAMGVAAAATVLVAVLIALTLLPAMVGFAQNRIRAPKKAASSATEESADADNPTARAGIGVRWARFVLRRPALILIGVVAAIGVLSIPTLDLRMGLGDASTAAEDTTQRKAYDIMSEGFGAGVNGPFTVMVDATGSANPAGAIEEAEKLLAGIPGVASVSPALPDAAKTTFMLSVVPTTGPSDEATKSLVGTIRSEAEQLHATTGAQISLTGQTAMNIDVSDKLSGALLPYLALIVGLAFILLMLVFRSLLVPIKATVGFLLTIGATFGMVVAVFQWGWLSDLFGVTPGPIMSLLPILMIGILFGLAMDYQVFLVTRMREDFVHGASPRKAIIGGFAHSSKVVVGAATIMVAVFAGFIVSEDSTIKSIGFALAMGVLIDAFVIRMTLVPAVMALLGKHAWWLPKWLDRILPKVDVEGESLAKTVEAAPEGPELVSSGRP